MNAEHEAGPSAAAAAGVRAVEVSIEVPHPLESRYCAVFTLLFDMVNTILATFGQGSDREAGTPLEGRVNLYAGSTSCKVGLSEASLPRPH